MANDYSGTGAAGSNSFRLTADGGTVSGATSVAGNPDIVLVAGANITLTGTSPNQIKITSSGGGGGGGIGGTIANTQVAFGTAADTIGGDANFTWTTGTGTLLLGATNAGFLGVGTATAPTGSRVADFQGSTASNNIALFKNTGGTSSLIQFEDTGTANPPIIGSNGNDLIFETQNAAGTLKFEVNASQLAMQLKADKSMRMIGKLGDYNDTAPTDGQLLIGDTAGAVWNAGTLTSSGGTVTITYPATGQINLEAAGGGAYTWIVEGGGGLTDTVNSGDRLTIAGGTGITTTLSGQGTATPTLTIDATGGGITGSGTAGQVTFWDGAATVTGDTGLTYANSVITLGDGTDEDIGVLFNSDSTDYYIGRDAGTENFVWGTGSTIGSNTFLSATTGGALTMGTSTTTTIGNVSVTSGAAGSVTVGGTGSVSTTDGPISAGGATGDIIAEAGLEATTGNVTARAGYSSAIGGQILNPNGGPVAPGADISDQSYAGGVSQLDGDTYTLGTAQASSIGMSSTFITSLPTTVGVDGVIITAVSGGGATGTSFTCPPFESFTLYAVSATAFFVFGNVTVS